MNVRLLSGWLLILLVCGVTSVAGELDFPGSVNGDLESKRLACGKCDGGCLGHVPFATVSLDALILDRSRVDSHDILFDSASNPTLNARDLDLGTDSDGRLGVVLYHEHGYDVEFNYMTVSGYVAAETVQSTGGSYLFYGGVPLTPADAYTAEYTSKMYSGELNCRWRVQSYFTLLGGFRVVDLQESFDILEAPSTGVFSVADNDLYGGQIGAEGLIWGNDYCRAVGTFKVGVFNNHASVRALATDAGGAPVTVNVRDERTAFVGEVTAGLVIPIWPGELRFGYQGLWLNNVALAPDQSDSLSFFAPGNIDFGTAAYHGAYLGWEATW